MFKRIFDRHKLDVSIISCGDTGQELGAGMISSLKAYGASVKSLAITSELEQHHKSSIFTRRFSVDDSHDGFAKKFEDGYQAAQDKRELIAKEVEEILPGSEGGLLLLTTGAGATGLGSTLVVIDILYKKFNRIPPIVTLLPETFENSRVQYNISLFLYRVAYKTDNFGNSVLLLDNKPTLKEMSDPMSEVARRRIEVIPNALADLLYASFVDSVSEEFDASTSDLFEVIHTPGISVFVSQNLGSDEESVDSSRIEDVISDSVISTTSLTKDGVFGAKNAYIAVFNIDQSQERLSLQTEFEARKLFREFRDTNPYVKIVNTEEDPSKRRPKLRAIIAGLPLPTRILQVMRLAREARKKIILQEARLEQEVINLDVDRVAKLEDNVKGLKK